MSTEWKNLSRMSRPDLEISSTGELRKIGSNKAMFAYEIDGIPAVTLYLQGFKSQCFLGGILAVVFYEMPWKNKFSYKNDNPHDNRAENIERSSEGFPLFTRDYVAGSVDYKEVGEICNVRFVK